MDLWTWEEWEDGTNWEVRIDVYTQSCVNDTSGKLLYSTGSSAQCSVMTWGGGMAGMGDRSKREGVYVYIADSQQKRCKAIILQ